MSRARYRYAKDEAPQTVRIEKIGFYGEGVGKSDSGDVFFVPFAVPGELVSARPLKRKRHYVEAELLEIIEASLDRVKPACELFTVCGGCQLQHLKYDVQVEQKKQILTHVVEKNLGGGCEIKAMASPKSFGYRRRVRLRQVDGKVGYFKRGTHRFLPVQSCPIARDEINAWISDEKNFPRPETSHDISLDVQEDGTLKTFEGPEQTRMGFRQANPWGEQQILSCLQEELSVLKGGVLELFSGEGALVLPWLDMRTHGLYVGVDGDPVNIDRGRARYGADNIRFEVGALPTWLIKREIQDPEFLSRFEVMVMDPPRCGLGEDLKHVKTLSALSKIIYISCDANSWLQDVQIFKNKHGFELKQVTMIDMFPHTRHFEIFSVLVR